MASQHAALRAPRASLILPLRTVVSAAAVVITLISLHLCDAVLIDPIQEAALLAIKSQWGNFDDSETWVSGTDCSEWAGISCSSDGDVNDIMLISSRVTGSISQFIGDLSALESLTLVGNALTGSLPDEISNLSSLQELYISGNGDGLSGPFPQGVTALTDLSILILSDNQLTGELPRGIGELTNLVTLSVSENRLVGPIPREISSLQRLTWLDLASNRLDGTIPSELSALQPLSELSLESNRLTGSIPASFAELHVLRALRLGHNRLSGPFPFEVIRSLKRLEFLGLQDNSLHATSLAPLATHPSLQYIDVSWNGISGSIPEEFGQMKNLTGLNVAGNALQGKVPRSLFGEGSQLNYLNLAYNEIGGIFPWTALSGMDNLDSITLSNNRFVGIVPSNALVNVPLTYLNISHNFFSGMLPDFGHTHGDFAADFRGNFFYGTGEVLVGGQPICPVESPNYDAPSRSALATMPATLVFATWNCLAVQDEICPMLLQHRADLCGAFCGTNATSAPCSGHGVCVPAATLDYESAPTLVDEYLQFECLCYKGYQLAEGSRHECVAITADMRLRRRGPAELTFRKRLEGKM